jgi:CheY-like chemotaxis protein
VARILVADDHDYLRRLLRLVLAGAGHQVWEAAGGAEALRLARRVRFDLLLCDLFKPVLGGPETLRQARRELPGLPVVLMSGVDAGVDAPWGAGPPAPCRGLGVSRVLSKPFTLPAVLAAVDEALGDARAA